MMKKVLASILALALSIAPLAAQQTPQGTAGQILGNDTAGTRNMRPASVTAILDRALGSTRGAIIYRGAGGWTILNPGATSGISLITNGTGADPSYSTVVAAGGGTGQTSYTLGDILYASGPSALSKLAGNITTTKQYLSQTGNGSVSAAPAWATIAGADITGAALTKTDDTNVTLTLGGTPATALLRAASLTLGWTGTLAVSRGGTGGGTASGTLLDNITAFSGTGYIRRTGAGAYAFSAAASGAQYLAGTATNVPIEPSVIYQAETVTTFGTTVTFDFQTFINTIVVLTGNITTMNVSNVTAGKSGTISFSQDGVGNRTTVWNSVFKFPGGVTPVLSTGIAAIDVLTYSCRSATFCVASLMKDVK